MRYIPALVAAAALALASVAYAGEFNDECAWGLANGKHVKTDCKINSVMDGKTYCFSSDKAKAAYMKNPSVNLSKATKTYGRS